MINIHKSTLMRYLDEKLNLERIQNFGTGSHIIRFQKKQIEGILWSNQENPMYLNIPIWNTKKRKEEDTIDVSQVAKNISRFMHHGNQTHFKEYKEWLMKLQQEINDVKNKK